MADPKSRARVQRLLSGAFRPDDLTGLFLYARDHCDGRENVTDIGDFVAHHNERDRGIITRSTRDWFTVSRFHMARFIPHQPSRNHFAEKMPPATRDYFKIAIDRMDGKHLQGRNRATAYKTMNDLAARLKLNPDGTWALPSDISATELSLVNTACSFLVVKPAFSDDRLVEDFLATLKSNGLISKDEIRDHNALLGALVKLYAVAAMHNAVVQIGDGTTTQLKATIHDGADAAISVTAIVPDAIPETPSVKVAADIFTANLLVTEHCHPDLLANRDWDFEIEVAPDKRLSPLR